MIAQQVKDRYFGEIHGSKMFDELEQVMLFRSTDDGEIIDSFYNSSQFP